MQAGIIFFFLRFVNLAVENTLHTVAGTYLVYSHNTSLHIL